MLKAVSSSSSSEPEEIGPSIVLAKNEDEDKSAGAELDFNVTVLNNYVQHR